MRNIFVIALLLLCLSPSYAGLVKSIKLDTKKVIIEADSRSALEILDLPEAATHARVFLRNSRGSNLALIKNSKTESAIKKRVVDGKMLVDLKTGKNSSIHDINIISYKKTRDGMKVIDTRTIQAQVEGDIMCSAAQKKVCGITYEEQSCPFADKKLCFFSRESKELTYSNLCELEQNGAEYLHKGSC